jgi:hypothetical protein
MLKMGFECLPECYLSVRKIKISACLFDDGLNRRIVDMTYFVKEVVYYLKIKHIINSKSASA